MENNFNLYYATITAGITLLVGIVLFIIQRALDRVFINPIQKQKATIEEIAVCLIHYANLYMNPVVALNDSNGSPKEQYLNAIEKTRELAALLKVRTDSIPLYDFWGKIRYVLPRKDVEDAWHELIGLSNSYSGRDPSCDRNSSRADKIRDLLNIPKAK